METPKDWSLILGDAFDLLKKVEPESVSLVLTDPPYNVSRKNQFSTMGRTGIDFEWDGDFDQERWLEAAVAALRPGGSLVVWNDWKNLGQIAKLLESHGMVIKRDLVWNKLNPMPRNTKRLPVQAREYALWAIKPRTKGKGDWTFNFEKTTDMPYHRGEWSYPVQRSINPTKKPDGLFAEIIRLFSNPGDLVLDPFVGCGTTLVASLLTGRRALCFEKNEDFYNDAIRRSKEVTAAKI